MENGEIDRAVEGLSRLPTMRAALADADENGYVSAGLTTARALRRRGLIVLAEAGSRHYGYKCTDLGQAVVDRLKAERPMVEKDVHTEHCCLTHGCKYGDEACPVESGAKPQSFPCEACETEEA